MKFDKNIEAFFKLITAGLWEREDRLFVFEGVDYSVLYKLANQQAVAGLLAAGLEYVDFKLPKADTLALGGYVLQLEHRNLAMNAFVTGLMERLRAADVEALLVKGQGIAQCYERPLWRAAGDVDLLLDGAGYVKAKEVLLSQADVVENEMTDRLHVGMSVDGWEVELHGTLRADIGRRIDKVIDAVQEDTFKHGRIRAWRCGDTEIALPCVDNDVFFVFTHILQHFYKEGVGLRQICDWCRLLWAYRETLDVPLLERRLRAAGIVSEWKAFAALAVSWLGMPADAMPLYDSSARWSARWERKARRIVSIILENGSFGRNRDWSYKQRYPYPVRKVISFCVHTGNYFKLLGVFRLHTLRAWWGMTCGGIRRVLAGV